MKKHIVSILIVLLSIQVFSQDATEIIKKADDKVKGSSSIATMTMKIVRPTWERTVSFKTWGKGVDYSLTIVTAPAKEKGQTFLKRQNDLWSWNPTIERMIKLPPSMMSQGWMGSDYSNDDILKESSIIVDYKHSLIGSENIEGKECFKINLMPKEDAAVVWGSIIKWISRDSYLQLKTQYFDEDETLIKTEIASEIKKMDDREIPTKIEIIPEDNKGNKTIVTIESIDFDVKLSDDFFSQQSMKKIR
ncbi:MAG: outer membrane lipoprotein-sorting protein [Bacteroidetes bacterium HGW-Bacteroidetes-1]|jgi:outer membrane lipoprotein-sorting protein|nr:MAG: outer membrane lipoprotein-sorting protein [Bacteroidetes bacterium HGW-Bacteroidetes-1]